jgi:hypothetical protein
MPKRVKNKPSEVEKLFGDLARVDELTKRLEEIRVDAHEELRRLGVPIAQVCSGMWVN